MGNLCSPFKSILSLSDKVPHSSLLVLPYNSFSIETRARGTRQASVCFCPEAPPANTVLPTMLYVVWPMHMCCCVHSQSKPFLLSPLIASRQALSPSLKLSHLVGWLTNKTQQSTVPVPGRWRLLYRPRQVFLSLLGCWRFKLRCSHIQSDHSSPVNHLPRPHLTF